MFQTRRNFALFVFIWLDPTDWLAHCDKMSRRSSLKRKELSCCHKMPSSRKNSGEEADVPRSPTTRTTALPMGLESAAQADVLALLRRSRSICRRDLIGRLPLAPMELTMLLRRMVSAGLIVKHGATTWAYYTLPDEPNPKPPATMTEYFRTKRLQSMNENRVRRGLSPLSELPPD